MVRWCSLVRVERREMKQLFHRKAGIECQSPVVTLMRASVRAPEGHGSNGRGVSPAHLVLEVEVEEMHGCMQCDGVRVGGYCIHTCWR